MHRLLIPCLALGLVSFPASSPALSADPAAEASQVRERSWHTSLTTARAEAAKQDKLIFVDLYADWCGWCRVLDRDVFSQPVFDGLARKLVLVRLDVEDRGEGARAQAHYGANALPTTLVLEPSGILVGKVTGVEEPAAYVASIERQIAMHRQVIGLYDQVVASRGENVGSEQVTALAEAFHKRGDGPRAAVLYRLLQDRLGATPPGSQDLEGRARLSFKLADAQRMAGEHESAARTAARARDLASRKNDDSLVEAIDLLGIQIATEIGDCDRRRQSMQSFLKAHPESRHHRRVESSLVALVTGTDGTGCS